MVVAKLAVVLKREVVDRSEVRLKQEDVDRSEVLPKQEAVGKLAVVLKQEEEDKSEALITIQVGIRVFDRMIFTLGTFSRAKNIANIRKNVYG